MHLARNKKKKDHFAKYIVLSRYATVSRTCSNKLLSLRISEWRAYVTSLRRWCTLEYKLREVPRKSFVLTIPVALPQNAQEALAMRRHDEIVWRESILDARKIRWIEYILGVSSSWGKKIREDAGFALYLRTRKTGRIYTEGGVFRNHPYFCSLFWILKL